MTAAALSPAGFDLRPAFVVTRRELRDQIRDWRIVAPILLLTLLFPVLMNFTADQAVRFVERYGALIISERLIPFLLMVVGFFPISVSLVIALESFVGEKERHSLEPLLATPLTNTQLYVGKMLASMLPPLLASYLGIAVYLAGLYFSIGWVADPILLAQILVLTTVQALVMVSGAVVISTQTTSVRAANLLASFIIIPMALLVQGESLIMFWARYDVLWWVIVGLLLVDGLLVRMGVKLFNREELLGREVDELNLAWIWRVFWRAFVGASQGSIRRWYRGEVVGAVRRIRGPLAIMAGAMLAAALLGWRYAGQFTIPPELINLHSLSSDFAARLRQFGLLHPAGAGWVLLINLRALALSTLLGMFSFGVLAVTALMAPLGLTGYFAGNVALAGMSPWAFLGAFILPHGLLEVPAAILAGGAILRLGASVISPSPGHSVGEWWLGALADWAKISLGLVLPLLVGAALIEVLVTPRIVMAVFGG